MLFKVHTRRTQKKLKLKILSFQLHQVKVILNKYLLACLQKNKEHSHCFSLKSTSYWAMLITSHRGKKVEPLLRVTGITHCLIRITTKEKKFFLKPFGNM